MNRIKVNHLLFVLALPALFFCYSFMQETVKKQEAPNTPPNEKKTAAGTKKETEPNKIKWLTFEQAVALNKKNPKKIIIDVYTAWCGWCKVMDKNTFTNPVVIKNINKYYYAVKLDAEMKDTIRFDDKIFVNPSPGTPKSTHQLAIALLNGQLGYPSIVYMDEKMQLIQVLQTYMTPQQIEPILRYFGEDAFKGTKWEDYQKNFKSELAAAPSASPQKNQ